MITNAYICDYTRTPIGRYGGGLSSVRTDDLAAIPLASLVKRNPDINWEAIDDVIMGCANQAGEDNRNVGRMATLLAGLPTSIPANTVNRLCGSGLNAVIDASRSIQCGAAQLVIAAGVESMSRAPFVIPKAQHTFSRNAEIYDSTIGWRFVNPMIEKQYGIDAMGETAENVAELYKISREKQDAFAFRSQEMARKSQRSDRLSNEITPVVIPQKRGNDLVVDSDEHPRETTREALANLSALFRDNGTVTAGNSSGINDGAAALIVASEWAVQEYGLKPIARVMGGAVAGVEPRVMGVGPVPAVRKLCTRLKISSKDFDVIELNEAFASQSLAVLQALEIDQAASHVNPNGGAIALGHPLGMSGVRICGSAAMELQSTGGRYALATMCVGVGQGIAVALESV